MFVSSSLRASLNERNVRGMRHVPDSKINTAEKLEVCIAPHNKERQFYCCVFFSNAGSENKTGNLYHDCILKCTYK